MAQYQEQLILEIKKVCRRGQTVENFVNNWIHSGQSFNALYQFLLSKGVETNRNSVWSTFRPMLTIPYQYSNQFMYKWNAIAKTKGFVNAKQMITLWKKQKYTQILISQELGLNLCDSRHISSTIEEILNDGKSFKKGEGSHLPKAKNQDGFARQDRILVWREKLRSLGYESLREALERMETKGMTFLEIAETLGITPRGLRWRKKRLEGVIQEKPIPSIGNPPKLRKRILVERRERG